MMVLAKGERGLVVVPEGFLVDSQLTSHPSQYQNCWFYQKGYATISLHKSGRTVRK